MKDFLKFTLATVAGIVLSGVLLFFLSMLALFGMLSTSDSEVKVPKDSVFKLELKGTLSERSQEDPFSFLLDGDYTSNGLDDVLASIRKAKENENIKGIYIEASTLMTDGYASLQEIRDALADFKASGKFVVAYADMYSQGLYYVASVADKVLMNPQGMLEWRGLASTPVYFKDLLAKIGVEMQIFKVGTYKSAVEPFISDHMSDADREQVSGYLNSLWDEMTQAVSASRGVPADSLNLAADRMMLLQSATECVTRGLVDTLLYKNDVRDYLKVQMGIDEDDNLSVLGLKDMLNVQKNVPKDKSGNLVAVYYAYGEIGSMLGSTGDEGIVAEKVIRDLRRLKEDEDIKAVVLRVNSPGGSAYDAEQIWHAVSELKKEKPVIVSMGDYAASGGYYISCVADSIVAEPTTLTGSIGIFGMVPNAEGLMQKVGLDFDVVKTNTYADFGALNRPFNEGERGLMQHYVEQGYDLFLTRCAEGRGMTKEAVDKIAQGRVWTGAKAKELGLVDELGGLNRAIEMAVEKAGVAEGYTLLAYPAKESMWQSLLNTDPGTYIKAHLLQGEAGRLYRQIDRLNRLDACDRIQARMPYEPNIH